MILQSLLRHAKDYWGRESLILVAEVDGVYLVEVVPPFGDAGRADNGHGNTHVIAYHSLSPGGWDGWCCNPSVMNGDLAQDTVPADALETFRNILSLL